MVVAYIHTLFDFYILKYTLCNVFFFKKNLNILNRILQNMKNKTKFYKYFLLCYENKNVVQKV